MAGIDYLHLEDRLKKLEQWLRENYLYEHPAEADEVTDGVPQPCSWCGSHQVVCDKVSPSKWQIYCNACEAGTDWYDTSDAAWHAWNAGRLINLSEVDA